jgi:hypothetical protein
MRGKGVLLVLCGIASIITFLVAADIFGLGGRPWYGWWDTNIRVVRPYVVAIAKPVPAGAASRAGLRSGDLVDLREQDEAARIAVLYQLMATQPTHLVVHRGAAELAVPVTGSTIWEGQPLWKFATMTSVTIASVFFIGCAVLIALRRSDRRDGRLLALVLLCIVGSQLNPDFFVVPSAGLQLALLVASQGCYAIALLLLIRLSSEFGERSAWRTVLGGVASVVALLYLVDHLAAVVGIHTLWIDPSPYVDRIGFAYGLASFIGGLAVVLTAIAAVATTPAAERPRAAWTVLALPIALFAQTIIGTVGAFVTSWYALVGDAALSDAMWLVGAWAVTYALLKRRVLDLEFVLSQTLVVGTVSAIVVAAFVLLEWLLGTVMAGVSHATGLIANGALALVLGLSLNPIHKRVDGFIEQLFFRERHENERALLEFSKEAVSVTNSEALLDQAIAKLERHTDARSATILLRERDAYVAVRSFGADAVRAVSENDPLILALKTWHKPVDPHHYASAVDGALALPMLARGLLIGLLALGERAGGEAYAPDEVEALAQFAHGVGTALDALSVKPDDSIAELRQAVASMAAAIASLGEETASLKRSIAG